jgi:hypothetical protein
MSRIGASGARGGFVRMDACSIRTGLGSIFTGVG